jgi:hypothetical protein
MTVIAEDDSHIISPLDVVAKEVKQDDRLCRQVYYTLLSTYTDDPVNLAINAPTGEGKSYVVKKVAELFPKSDVLFLSAMSDKALFHRPGILVTKDENGEYTSIEDKVAEIDSEIEDKQSEINVVPLVNAGYIDKVENKNDKRSYLFYPVLNGKQKKLFDLTGTNIFSQQKAISVINSTIFPDRTYLISKIQVVLRYSSEIHKITKLENHEGKEITAEELVDQYYKDPDKYFEVNGGKSNVAPPSSGDGGAGTTAIVISTTSIQPLEIKNNIKKERVSNEYSLDAKYIGKSQQILEKDAKSIENGHEKSTKLFDLHSSNNFIIFKCYYCKYQTNVEREYQCHVVLKHPGKLAYPSKADLEKIELKPQAKSWEIR